VSEESREAAAAQLDSRGMPSLAEQIRTVVPADDIDANRVFGESLPEGLTLA
jgi:hypothetical protein